MIDSIPDGRLDETMGRDDRSDGWMDINFPMPPFDSVRGILNRSIGVYAENFGLIFKLTALLLLPLVLLEYVIIGLMMPSANFETIGMIQAVSTILNYLLTWLVTPALVYGLVVRLRDRRAAGLSECLSWGVRKWLPSIGWGIVVTLLTILGCALFFVPGLLAGTWLFMIYAVIAIEGPSRGNAFSRCIELTRGYAWQVFGVLFILCLVLFGLGAGYGGVAGYLAESGMYSGPAGWAVAIVGDCVMELVWPIAVVASVLMYLGIRAGGRPRRCLKCGYPLAGNTTGFCPECGEALPENAITDLPV